MPERTHDLARLHINGAVATVTLNRPDARNALSEDLLNAVTARLNELESHDNISVCILAGEGRAFCAGMDLKAVLDVPGAPARLLNAIAELTLRLRDLPAVTVARVQGAAIGGGCGLMTVCDYAITHPDAKIGYPEVDLGVCPAVVAPWLVRRLGAGAARRVLLSGGTMSGEDAHRIGLVSSLAPREELQQATDDLMSRLASAAPRALRATRDWLNRLDPPDLPDLVRRGAAISTEVVTSDEARASLRAAFERKSR